MSSEGVHEERLFVVGPDRSSGRQDGLPKNASQMITSSAIDGNQATRHLSGQRRRTAARHGEEEEVSVSLGVLGRKESAKDVYAVNRQATRNQKAVARR